MKKILTYGFILAMIYGLAFYFSSKSFVTYMAGCAMSLNIQGMHDRGVPDRKIREKMNECVLSNLDAIDEHFFSEDTLKDMHLNWD